MFSALFIYLFIFDGLKQDFLLQRIYNEIKD